MTTTKKILVERNGPVTTIGPSAKLSRTPVALGRPSPLPGSDAASVLAEIGMADQLERLVKAGVVVMSLIAPLMSGYQLRHNWSLQHGWGRLRGLLAWSILGSMV